MKQAIHLKKISFFIIVFLLPFCNTLFGQEMHAFVDDVQIRDFEFEGSKVWALTENSLVCFDTISGQKTFYNYSNSGLGFGLDELEIDDFGNKLVIDYYGLHILNSNNVWTDYDQIGGYPVNGWFILNKDRQGKIWITPTDSTTTSFTKFYIWENQSFTIHNNWAFNMPEDEVDFDMNGNLYYPVNGYEIYKVDSLLYLNSIPGIGSVTDLSVTAAGIVWITNNNDSTFKKIFPDGSDSTYLYSDYGINFTGNGDVRTYRDLNDNIYFYKNSQSGVFKYNGSSFTNIGSMPNTYKPIYCIGISATNTLYRGSYSMYKQSNGNLLNIDMGNSLINGNIFVDVAIDHAGNKWFAVVMGGIMKFDGITWTPFSAPNNGLITNDLIDIFVSHDDKVWFTTSSNIVGTIVNGVVSYLQGFSFNLGYVATIVEDKFNNIWIRGNEGLYKFNGVNWTYFFATNSTDFNTYSQENTIATDTLGNIWGTTISLGLFKFDTNNQYTYFPNATVSGSLPVDNVFCDNQNNIYFTTVDINFYTSISRVYDGNTFSDFTVDGFSFMSRLQESATTALYITYGGLYRVQGTNFTQLLPIEKIQTTAMAIDNGNNIWLPSRQTTSILCYNENGFGYFPFQGVPLNEVSGKVFYDVNQNGLEEPNDIGLPWKEVKNNTNNTVLYTNTSGNYVQYLPDGAYTMEEHFQASGSTILTSDSASYHFTLNQSSANNLNFGAYIDAIQDSLVVSFIPGLIRCNTTNNNWITISNYSINPFSGNINLQFDDSVNFSFNSPQGTLNGNIATWQIDSLMPFQTLTFSFVTQNPTVAFIANNPNETVDYSLTVSNSNVIYSSNYSYPLLCSYDPNFKEVNPAGIGEYNHTLVNTPLEYTLHFQNMGNDTAFHVLVTDTLSSILNPETFEYIAASHPLNIARVGNILKFDFPQINLLPKSMNEPLSQGFVKFRIKTFENLPDYTVLKNTANIYFDFNLAVITNTSLNTLVYELDVSIDEPSKLNNQVLVYPNPAHNVLTIDSQNGSIEICIITNAIGQTVYNSANEINGNHKIQLNISNLSVGVYFVKVRTSNGSYMVKFIKAE
jgi:uncharacterized repeat protein (TIGR01451 family)